MARRILLLFLLLAGGDLFAAESKPQYTRTRQLPALKMSFTDMQLVLDKAAHLLADANKANEADEAKVPEFIKQAGGPIESYPSETLTLGTGPDEIQIRGHSFPANARVPKAAYALSYSYSGRYDAPVSKLELDLRDYGRRLSVNGSAVDQVEAISAALENDLSQYSAIGGDTVRLFATLIILLILVTGLLIGGAVCVLKRQWRYVGVPIVCLIGLVVVILLPLKDAFAGFAMYQGEASWIVRNAPQIAFVGLIITIVLSFVIPMWQDAAKRKTA